MLLDISVEVKYIKKSICYETQHLMHMTNFSLNFENRNSKSEKWILVMLSITVTCCQYVYILIRSPLMMTFLHQLSKFHGYIINGSGEK